MFIWLPFPVFFEVMCDHLDKRFYGRRIYSQPVYPSACLEGESTNLGERGAAYKGKGEPCGRGYWRRWPCPASSPGQMRGWLRLACSCVRRRSVRRVPLWPCALLSPSFTPAARTRTASVGLRRSAQRPPHTLCPRPAWPCMHAARFLAAFRPGLLSTGSVCCGRGRATHARRTPWHVLPRGARSRLCNSRVRVCVSTHPTVSLAVGCVNACCTRAHTLANTHSRRYYTLSHTHTLPRTHTHRCDDSPRDPGAALGIPGGTAAFDACPREACWSARTFRGDGAVGKAADGHRWPSERGQMPFVSNALCVRCAYVSDALCVRCPLCQMPCVSDACVSDVHIVSDALCVRCPLCQMRMCVRCPLCQMCICVRCAYVSDALCVRCAYVSDALCVCPTWSVLTLPKP